jgi:hypothetical protein
MYTTSKARHVKGVSLSIGGYLDWMKRSASFIYPVTIMASRSFVNGNQKFCDIFYDDLWIDTPTQISIRPFFF